MKNRPSLSSEVPVPFPRRLLLALVLISLLLVALLLVPGVASAQQGATATVGAGRLNVRTGPGVGYDVITIVDYGTGFIIFTVIIGIRFFLNLFTKNLLDLTPQQFENYPFRIP